MLFYLSQHKPEEVSRRPVEVPQKKADKSKPLHRIFRLFSKKPATDKTAGNGLVLFPSVLGCDMIAGRTWIMDDTLTPGDENSV